MLKMFQCAELPHACPYAAHPVHTTVNVVPHAGSTASTHKRAAEIIAFCDRARGEKQQSAAMFLWRTVNCKHASVCCEPTNTGKSASMPMIRAVDDFLLALASTSPIRAS
ncbi:hypothetical protein V8C43DRAFT_11870 [Trichoderma afarasin]